MILLEYLQHYLVLKDALLFFLLAILGCIGCVLLIVIFDRLLTLSIPANKRKNTYNTILQNTVQRFYGIVFSGASILSFLAVYYLLDKFLENPEYIKFWNSKKDFLLLIMIVISIILNNIFDHFIVPLKKIDNEERNSLRVVGMIYVVLIFMYIKYIYENPNYDGFIMYFLGLMVGRFIYFDASFKEFITIMKSALRQIPIMILGLAYTALMCYFGFKYKYLLKVNGVLVSTFIAHLFMIVAIFIIHHSHLILLFTMKKKR